MRWGNQSVVWHFVMVLVVLVLAEGGRADVGGEVRQESLLGIVVRDAASYRPVGKASMDIRRRDGVPYCSAVSDANGVAWIHLTPGQYTILGAVCEGYAYEGQPQTVAVGPGDIQQVEMILTPNLRGLVRDPGGMPTMGASINLIGAGRDATTSDGQGRFEIAWDRRCQLRQVSTFSLVARYERRNLAALIEINADASGAVNVQLQPGATLTGRIADPNGRGIAGARVYVTLDVPNWSQTPLGDEQTRTDANGGFEIPAVPVGGRYTLHACADGYGSKEAVVTTKIVAGRPFDVGSLTLVPARLSVAGRVLDTQGYPIARAMIYGWGDGQPLKLQTQTDVEGRFALTGVCAGRVDLRVDADWGGGTRLRARLFAAAGDTGLEIVPLHPFTSRPGTRGPTSRLIGNVPTP